MSWNGADCVGMPTSWVAQHRRKASSTMQILCGEKHHLHPLCRRVDVCPVLAEARVTKKGTLSLSPGQNARPFAGCWWEGMGLYPRVSEQVDIGRGGPLSTVAGRQWVSESC